MRHQSLVDLKIQTASPRFKDFVTDLLGKHAAEMAT